MTKEKILRTARVLGEIAEFTLYGGRCHECTGPATPFPCEVPVRTYPVREDGTGIQNNVE